MKKSDKKILKNYRGSLSDLVLFAFWYLCGRPSRASAYFAIDLVKMWPYLAENVKVTIKEDIRSLFRRRRFAQSPVEEGLWSDICHLPVKTETRVICGFPGVGKSYLTTCHAGDLEIHDSDSSSYKGRVSEYVDHIESLSGIVLVSTHQEVRDELARREIPYELCFPDLRLKDEYLRRFRHRGNDDAFVELLDKNWDDWILGLFSDRRCVEKHILKRATEYLWHVIEKQVPRRDHDVGFECDLDIRSNFSDVSVFDSFDNPEMVGGIPGGACAWDTYHETLLYRNKEDGTLWKLVPMLENEEKYERSDDQD